MTIEELEQQVGMIYNKLVESESIAEKIARGVDNKYSLSAKNLFRYLVLRSFDLRQLHDDLSDLGISSMRSSEAYVYTNLFNVLKLLNLLQGKEWSKEFEVETIGYDYSKKLLRKHANELFNEVYKKHFTEIMVTLPNEAAEDKDLVRRLANEGMEIARINLSHGNLEIWERIVKNIDEVKQETGLQIKVFMDLSGPKIRTSKIGIRSKKGQVKEFITLAEGDKIILTKRDTLGKELVYRKKSGLVQKAEVGVLLPQIIDDLKVGDLVYFDDGMIKGQVIGKDADDAELEIIKAYKPKLSSNKGINLPNTKLNLPSLTDRDIELLPFACKYADIIGYSFVRSADDVKKLYDHLSDNDQIGVVFKIENQEAFENLPLILFEAMKRSKIGVMIARGDLAVEIGFERISEVQNQILWLCEAAHVPVIWATQVLDNLAKTGMATRAEVSDAALSTQAECVMLNKGPYIVDAVRTLKEILIKMEAHGFKKKSSLRPLNVAKLTLSKMEVKNLSKLTNTVNDNP